MFDISVLITSFNRAEYLRAAVSSALEDTRLQVQVIVVDDGSTDGSAETVEDLPITLIRLKKNIGQYAASNRGLRECRGRYITFLDSDDLLFPGGLYWRYRWLEDRPRENAVGGSLIRIDENGTPTPVQVNSRCGFRIDWDYVQRYFFAPVGPAFFLYRSSLIQKVGDFLDLLSIADELDFQLRAIRISPIVQFPEPVIYYRLHGKNKSCHGTLGLMGPSGRSREYALAYILSGIDPTKLSIKPLSPTCTAPRICQRQK